MKNGHEYFAKQEEDISNTYMSANGEGNNYYNQSGFSKGVGNAWKALFVLSAVGYISYKKYGTKGLLYGAGGIYLLTQLGGVRGIADSLGVHIPIRKPTEKMM
jgi:hypothetical protein